MHIAYFEPLSRAWERMKQILWRPFDPTKWLVIGFAAWLSRLFNGGSGTGGKWIFDNGDTPWGRSGLAHSDSWRHLGESLFVLPLIFILVMAVAAILVLVLWLSSRAKFIFVDNLVQDRAQIVEPWHRLRDVGNSLFLWRLGFIVVSGLVFLALAVLIFVPAATFSLSDALAGLSYAAIAVFFLVLFALGIVVAYIDLFLEAFIVPIMYKFEIKATEAWRYFLPWFKTQPLPFLLYGLFIFLFGIAAFAVYSVACLLTCCILALPYVGTVLTLWFWATYRLFSIEFLAQFDPGFDLFTPPEAPVAE